MVAVIIIPHVCLDVITAWSFFGHTIQSLGKCFGPVGFHGKLPGQEEALMAVSKKRESAGALGSPVPPGPFLCGTKVGPRFSAWPGSSHQGACRRAYESPVAACRGSDSRAMLLIYIMRIIARAPMT